VPSWDQLLNKFGEQPEDERGTWMQNALSASLAEIANKRGTNVLLYSSSFLQKPQLPGQTLMITHEDLNGMMGTIYGMDWSKGLTLLLHTPGGDPNAANSIVDYLRRKFDSVEVVVPALAMSAGTMISLASDRVVMGKQSQLGPIDPQWTQAGRTVSARAVVEQFERAKADIAQNQTMAHLWAPILQSLGPALLQESQNALDYSETMVAEWLARWMFKDNGDAEALGRAVAHHFNDASTHKSHGRRIDRDEAQAQGVVVENLEADQDLQEKVLTAYHLMTICFEQTAMVKMLWSHEGRTWIKNWAGQA
jgi:hypothetical protein